MVQMLRESVAGTWSDGAAPMAAWLPTAEGLKVSGRRRAKPHRSVGEAVGGVPEPRALRTISTTAPSAGSNDSRLG